MTLRFMRGYHEASAAIVKQALTHQQEPDSIDAFLEGFPSVSREQVLTSLQQTKRVMCDARIA